MKTVGDLLHKTPWWALLLSGAALLFGLAAYVTPVHMLRLERSGATPQEKQAIKREIDATFSEGAIDMAGRVVRELRDHSRDPVRRKELERALGEIEQARASLRGAAEEARAAADAAKAAAAEASGEAAAQDEAPAAVPAPAEAPKERKRQRRIVIPGLSRHPTLDIQLDAPPGIQMPPLPPDVRAQIRKGVTGDLYRIGVGAGLFLLFVPLFILTVVAKVFIDRSRAAQRQADVERREAEYQRMGRQVTEAKLAALQAQVEPHFLYNTLASVQALTEVDPQRASEMTGHLIQYLRNALPKMRESVSTLGQEIELVRAYLSILQMRMGERLRFEIAVPPELLDVAFPPLMLPSLVENAIKHGLEPQREGGEVSVSATALDGRLRVSVADTGRGFGEAPGQGVGLTNIRERLAALYGDAARLTLEARVPRGVTATIEVPRVGLRAAPAADSAGAPASAGMARGSAPAGAARRTLAAMGTAERAWRKGLSFTFVVLVAIAAVLAGLAVVGVTTGLMPVHVGGEEVGGAAGALLGTAGIAAAFGIMVLALAVVFAIVYGLGFLFVALALFIPLVILVALFPVLAPFILVALGVWWLVRRARRNAAAPAPPAPPFS